MLDERVATIGRVAFSDRTVAATWLSDRLFPKCAYFRHLGIILTRSEEEDGTEEELSCKEEISNDRGVYASRLSAICEWISRHQH